MASFLKTLFGGKSAAGLAVQPVAGPAVELVAEPTAELAVEPVAELAAEPVAEPAREPKRIQITPLLDAIRGDWGTFLALHGDTVIPGVIEEYGSWGAHDVEAFKAEIKPGDFVLDIGANIGHHTVVYSKLVGPAGAVLGIEAQRPIHAICATNLVANGCENAIVVHCAAAEAARTVKMYPISYSGTFNYGALPVDHNHELANGENVQAVAVDDLVSEHFPDRRVAFVKIDIQSYELFALRGMQRILAQDKPILFLEISPHWMMKTGYDYREIYTLLKGFGYTMHDRHPALPYGDDGFPDIPFDSMLEWDVVARVES